MLSYSLAQEELIYCCRPKDIGVMGICLHHVEMIVHNQFLFILVVHSRDKDGYGGKPQSKSILDDDGAVLVS